MASLLDIQGTMMNGMAVRYSHLTRAAEWIDALNRMIRFQAGQGRPIEYRVEELFTIFKVESEDDKSSLTLILADLSVIGYVDCIFRVEDDNGNKVMDHNCLATIPTNTKVQNVRVVYRLPSRNLL